MLKVWGKEIKNKEVRVIVILVVSADSGLNENAICPHENATAHRENPICPQENAILPGENAICLEENATCPRENANINTRSNVYVSQLSI